MVSQSRLASIKGMVETPGWSYRCRRILVSEPQLCYVRVSVTGTYTECKGRLGVVDVASLITKPSGNHTAGCWSEGGWKNTHTHIVSKVSAQDRKVNRRVQDKCMPLMPTQIEG